MVSSLVSEGEGAFDREGGSLPFLPFFLVETSGGVGVTGVTLAGPLGSSWLRLGSSYVLLGYLA